MENKNVVIKPIALAVALSFIGGASAVGTGTIVSGSGAITQKGNEVNVKQSTDKMIINWNNMNVGKNEKLNFSQPTANAAVLNKINSLDPTVIAGALSANGKVFIVNPNGVLISKGATVNVGSLIASALDISKDDFLKGKFNFKGDGKGKVVNEGTINAKDAVAMLGAGEVTNNGNISATSGGAALAAGSDITLYFPAMGKMSVKVNKGSLNALINNGGLIVSEQGNVSLSAWATDTLTRGVINNTGVLEAKGFKSTADGGIYLTSAGNGDVNVGGRLTSRQKGKIDVSGQNIHVSDGTALNAQSTLLASTREGGYVQLGRTEVERGTTTISTDNVFTTAAGKQSSFADNVTVATRSKGVSVDVADSSVNGKDQIRNGQGVVGAGLIDAVAKSGKTLTVTNNFGDINVNNARQNYGKLALNSGKNINLNREMKGDSLTVNALQINQSAAAKISMKDEAKLSSTFDLVQQADVTANNVSLSSANMLKQSNGVTNTAKNLNYTGADVELQGNSQANSLMIMAGDKVTEGSAAKITATKLDLYGGDVNLSAGKNHVDEINAQSESLKLSNLVDTTLSGDSFINGDLSLSTDKNLQISGAFVRGDANLKANGDVRINGKLRTGGSIDISGQNILSGSWGATQNSLDSDSNITLNAKNKVDLNSVNFLSNAFWDPSPEGQLRNNLKVTAQDISFNTINAAGNTYLTNTKSSSGKQGNITLGSSTIFGNLTAKTEGDVVLNNNLKALGDVNIAANNLTGSASETGYPWMEPQRAGINAGNLDLQIKNDIKLGELTAQSNTLTPEYGNAKVTANNVFVDALNSTFDLALSAQNDVSVKALKSGQASSLESFYSPDTTINGNTVTIASATVGGDIAVKANKDIHYDNGNGMANTTLTSKHGSVFIGPEGSNAAGGNAFNNLTITAADKVSMNGYVSTFGDLTVTAGKSGIFLPFYLDVMGNAVLTTTGNIGSNAVYGWYNINQNLTYVVSKTSKIANAYGDPLMLNVYGETKTIRK